MLPGGRRKAGPAVSYIEDGERLDLLLPGGRRKAGPAVTWKDGERLDLVLPT
jgi:hypothetical protein